MLMCFAFPLQGAPSSEEVSARQQLGLFRGVALGCAAHVLMCCAFSLQAAGSSERDEGEVSWLFIQGRRTAARVMVTTMFLAQVKWSTPFLVAYSGVTRSIKVLDIERIKDAPRGTVLMFTFKAAGNMMVWLNWPNGPGTDVAGGEPILPHLFQRLSRDYQAKGKVYGCWYNNQPVDVSTFRDIATLQRIIKDIQ